MVQIEIESFSQTRTGIVYTVVDYIILEGGAKQFNSRKEVAYDNEKINQLDQYLKSFHDYSDLSKTDREWAKIKDALLFVTQTDLYPDGLTIYWLQPSDWELST